MYDPDAIDVILKNMNMQKEKSKRRSGFINVLLIISRISFVFLLLFELANYTHILSFTLSYTWFGLLVTAFFIFFGIILLELVLKSNEIKLVPWLALPLGLLMVGVDFFGDLYKFYDRWIWYDRVAHFMAGVLISGLLFGLLRNMKVAHDWKIPQLVLLFLTLSTNTVFAVFYEFEEYLEDYFFKTNRLGNGPDTVNDLLVNFFGSLIFLSLAWTYSRIKSRRNASQEMFKRSLSIDVKIATSQLDEKSHLQSNK